MRHGNEAEWLVENDVFFGIDLGADYVAEHEIGIKHLNEALGIDKTREPGIARRLITQHGHIRLYAGKKTAMLLCLDSWYLQRIEKSIEEHGFAKGIKESMPRDLGFLDKNGIATSWDDSSFGIRGEGKLQISRIKELAQAFEKNNIAVWCQGRVHPFKNGGLIICIADRIPTEGLETMQKGDLDIDRLYKASEETGILKRLKDAQKGYFACSPKWRSEDKPSAYPVVYWLNPVDQRQNNFGWFTVEELDQWIAGGGPVLKSSKATS